MVSFKQSWLALLGKTLAVLLLGSLLCGAVAVSILGGEETFSDTYQSVIQRKYERLKNTTGKRIIIVGGSSAGFGIAADYMEAETGYTVVNMGLHAGFGPLFNTEIIKDHIQEGDIILLAYEHGLQSDSFDKLGDLNLIMAGIDNHLQMYQAIPVSCIPQIMGNLFDFGKYKATKTAKATGVYSSESFDEKGNMVLSRKAYEIPNYKDNIDIYTQVDGAKIVADSAAAEEAYDYLKELKDYVEKKGAHVYMVAAPLLQDAYVGTEQQMLDYAHNVQNNSGILFISSPYDYVFPSEYMFDTIYHCNNAGELKRTELLINDLRSHGIIEKTT